jgi:FkbM family methyltransferase
MDIGANVGQHSIFAAALADRVYSFEPNPAPRASLERNIAANRIINIEVHPCGLGERHARLPFFLPQGVNSGTGSFLPAHGSNNDRTPSATFEVIAGDTLALRNIGLVKIDVEGFEVAVLRGLRNTLMRERPYTILEYEMETRREIRTIADLRALFPDQYSFYRLSRTTHSRYCLSPIKSLDQCQEILAAPQERSWSHSLQPELSRRK